MRETRERSKKKKQRTKTQNSNSTKTNLSKKKTSPQSPDPAKHYGLTRVLDAPVKLANAENKDFVFQYDVKFTDGLTCGGEEEGRRREREKNEIFLFGDLKTRNFLFSPRSPLAVSLSPFSPLSRKEQTPQKNQKTITKTTTQQEPTPSSSPTSTPTSRPRTSSTRRRFRSCLAPTSAARPTRST